MFCSASIAMILKFSEEKKCNRFAVTTANYFTAFLVSVAMIISNNILNSFSFLDFFTNFSQEFIPVFTAGNTKFSSSSSVLWGIITGIPGGLFYFLGFIYILKSIEKNGVSMTGVFARLGILIPIAVSIIFWEEYPAVIQISGMFLALFAIVAANISLKESAKFSPVLLILFLTVGAGEFINKFFQKYALETFTPIFLFSIFFTAFLISLFYLKPKTAKTDKSSLILGFLVGIPNIFSTYFFIKALETVKAGIAYPAYSAGTIILIALGGKIIFKEKLSTIKKIALCFAAFAIVMMNMGEQ